MPPIQSDEPAPRVVAPRPPAPPPPYSLPVVATVAPMLLAVAMWLLTTSPFALLFAFLGPVVAVASLADSRIQARRVSRRETRRFQAEVSEARRAILARHDEERAALEEAVPSAPQLTLQTTDASRWALGPADPVLVALGSGTGSSGLTMDSTAGSSPDTEPVLRELRLLAAVLPGVPITADARLGIGVCGPGPLATALARSLVVQLARQLSPARHWCAWNDPRGEWEWLSYLPHPVGPVPRSGISFGRVGEEEDLVSISTADTLDELPGTRRVVVTIGGRDGAWVLEHPNRASRVRIEPAFLTTESAASWAKAASASAVRDGLVDRGGSIPSSVSLGPLLPAGAADTGSLACQLGISAIGPLTLDLVSEGPHAIVGGTTGSGKSELLVSWILGMAAAASPAEVNFLLVDFKGGAAFGGLERLPHTVGVITDLDERGALRALESLKAELRHRERRIAEAGVRSIDDLARAVLPRLVVVVDEFAAVMTGFHDLHTLFNDIASRGRSLGVHLVLCTQRPAEVVRDGVLANANLRISLRVNNRSDSLAVVGTDAAAGLSGSGRALTAASGTAAREFQVAMTGPADLGAVLDRWPGDWLVRRPWCEPLPGRIEPSALPPVPGALVFGLVDLPAEQRQGPAAYQPHRQGNLLVLGGHRSGKTTALCTIAAAAGGGEWIAGEVERAWDLVTEALENSGTAGPDRLLVLDDLDLLLSRFDDEYRPAFLDRLARLLRSGPSRGIRLALAAQRATGELQPLVPLAPALLLLRQSNRQEHLLAGGGAGDFDPNLGPGGGIWCGARVQVAIGGPDPGSSESTYLPVAPEVPIVGPLAVVSSRPVELATVFRRAGAVVAELGRDDVDPTQLTVSRGGGHRVIIGGIEDWQSRWGAIQALREHCDIVFDGCGTADFRSLSRVRDLPPPLSAAGSCWLLPRGAVVVRARLPGVDSVDDSVDDVGQFGVGQ